MATTSVFFAFRDRIISVIADLALKALRNECDYRTCCNLPKLTESLGITPVQMNKELQTLVGRGYVAIQDETAFPTWKTLRKHPDFKGISLKDAQDIIARLKVPTGMVLNGTHEQG